MHIILYFIPWHHKSGSMSTEYRTRGIVQVTFGIISNLLQFHPDSDMGHSPSMNRIICPVPLYRRLPVSDNLASLIQVHSPSNHHIILIRFRLLEGSIHFLNVSHSTPDHISRNLKSELIIWLKQDTLCFL